MKNRHPLEWLKFEKITCGLEDMEKLEVSYASEVS
jgi:hypothetical protein